MNSNIFLIAKKEFVDLLNNWMVLVVLLLEILCVLTYLYTYYYAINSNGKWNLPFQENLGGAAANLAFSLWTMSSLIIGVMIGSASISSERHGNALNTLVVKPVYRDTIINGKLTGSIIFLMFIMVLSAVIYTLGLLILCGNTIYTVFPEYCYRLILGFIFAVIFNMIFLSLSILYSVIIKDQAFSLILSLISIYLLNGMQNINFAGNLGVFLHDSELARSIINFTPMATAWSARFVMFDTSYTFMDSFNILLPVMAKYVIFTLIVLFISYTIFIRRDIS